MQMQANRSSLRASPVRGLGARPLLRALPAGRVARLNVSAQAKDPNAPIQVRASSRRLQAMRGRCCGRPFLSWPRGFLNADGAAVYMPFSQSNPLGTLSSQSGQVATLPRSEEARKYFRTVSIITSQL
eukprot:XP_001697953.1 predicted protein [Chlamydomonas reinhardtii]